MEQDILQNYLGLKELENRSVSLIEQEFFPQSFSDLERFVDYVEGRSVDLVGDSSGIYTSSTEMFTDYRDYVTNSSLPFRVKESLSDALTAAHYLYPSLVGFSLAKAAKRANDRNVEIPVDLLERPVRLYSAEWILQGNSFEELPDEITEIARVMESYTPR